jgi:hypothetical protein
MAYPVVEVVGLQMGRVAVSEEVHGVYSTCSILLAPPPLIVYAYWVMLLGVECVCIVSNDRMIGEEVQNYNETLFKTFFGKVQQISY